MVAVNVEEDRRIHGRGTPEDDWRGWAGLAGLASSSPARLVPAGCRAVVVAPHPDDEVLGCGGLLAMLARAGRQVLVVAVTDGDASHPGSTRWPRHALAHERSRERLAGLSRLGLDGAVERLRIPDGGVAAAQASLTDRLIRFCDGKDVLISPWRLDGHPDHEAVGRAAWDAAAEIGARLVEMPIWMWHWATPGDRRVPWHAMRRVPLDAEAMRRKREAIAAHATQLQVQDDMGREAVLPPWALERNLRPFECFFADAERP